MPETILDLTHSLILGRVINWIDEQKRNGTSPSDEEINSQIWEEMNLLSFQGFYSVSVDMFCDIRNAAVNYANRKGVVLIVALSRPRTLFSQN